MSRGQVVLRLTMRQASMIAVSLSFVVLVAAFLTESKPVMLISLINLIITVILVKTLMKGW